MNRSSSHPILHHRSTAQAELVVPVESRAFTIGKRLIDVVIALPVVIFVLPVLMVFMWGLQLCVSRGTLFFRQQRCGKAGSPFSILKFRTMTPQHSSSSDSDDNIESRVFRFGHLVRFSKIDEIPQFLNVLRGEMSVVGPRPHHLKDSVEFEARVPGYRQRFSVKPGITGLAQIREYAGEFQWDCTDSRVKADLDYIRNQSPWNDLHLIVRTFTTVLWKCQQRIFRSLIAVQEDQAETVVPFAEHAKPRTSEAKSDGRSSRKAA